MSRRRPLTRALAFAAIAGATLLPAGSVSAESLPPVCTLSGGSLYFDRAGDVSAEFYSGDCPGGASDVVEQTGFAGVISGTGHADTLGRCTGDGVLSGLRLTGTALWYHGADGTPVRHRFRLRQLGSVPFPGPLPSTGVFKYTDVAGSTGSFTLFTRLGAACPPAGGSSASLTIVLPSGT